MLSHFMEAYYVEYYASNNYRYTSGVHYFSINSTAQSQLFCLYYDYHSSKHCSDDLFQHFFSGFYP